MPCADYQKKLSALKTLASEFDAAWKQKDVAKAKRMKTVMEEKVGELQQELAVELLTLRAHKEERVFHEKAGFLEKLSNGREGIKDIFNTEHPFPSQEEVLSRVLAKKELITRKMGEYEKPRLLIVPFGKSLPDLAKRWKEALVQRKDTLHNEDGTEETVKTDMTGQPYENGSSPVWVWSQYETAETSGDLVYDPQSLGPNHRGKTKKRKLAELGGYSIILIDDLTDLPAEGQATARKGRMTPEANRSPEEYFSLLKEAPYLGEGGFYPEETLYYYIRNLLENEGLVTDNYQKNGKASFSLGGYFKGSAGAPYSSWNSVGSRGYLDRDVVSARDSGSSVRFRVGV